ncbi:hypothetical protein D3C87_1920740 [compost metagenome]
MRDSDSRKSSRKVGANASSKPDSESITTRVAFSRLISLNSNCTISSMDRSGARLSTRPT